MIKNISTIFREHRDPINDNTQPSSQLTADDFGEKKRIRCVCVCVKSLSRLSLVRSTILLAN